jgi:hypothetical protein
LDNDDLDLIVNNVNMEAFVFQNNSEKQKQSFYKSETKRKGQNKFGVGSVVELFSGEKS